jgi:predicted nucleotidyltransferase component of viral defense system
VRDLIRQEQFELEVLDRLNSKKLLNSMLFVGGTMLRLCYGLGRYSVDLDFWMKNSVDSGLLYKKVASCLEQSYAVKDKADKHNTLLFEVKSKDFPRSLKVEIRKQPAVFKAEQAIAYSRHSDAQVMVKTISLERIMESKIEAFLNRNEIRDVFDMEFLVKKGIKINVSDDRLKALLKGIAGFSTKDYSVKLGSLLEEDQRKYYRTQNFKILKMALEEKLKA